MTTSAPIRSHQARGTYVTTPQASWFVPSVVECSHEHANTHSQTWKTPRGSELLEDQAGMSSALFATHNIDSQFTYLMGIEKVYDALNCPFSAMVRSCTSRHVRRSIQSVGPDSISYRHVEPCEELTRATLYRCPVRSSCVISPSSFALPTDSLESREDKAMGD